jgi:glycosyltransferase involved in cell wall biosynthesis
MQKELFFSIVIPAHNEELYIENTLRHVLALEYPKESYEVIVVENASTDNTYERARNFLADNVHVHKIPDAGVSRARNFGASVANKDADWIFFLDADTYPEPPFLRSLANFLHAHANHGYVVGAAELRPVRSSFFMNTLYWFSNTGMRLTKVANGSALFVKRSLMEVISFDEEVAVGEDELFTKKVETIGLFFFFGTNLVHTSTRRFENGGWQKIPAWVGIWIFAMILPHHGESFATFQRRLKYEVVR